ncbi:MAG: FtsX-like permease family protein [Candidatus Bathyarchaeota archaeon]|nr:FtsX-like permease family protein [Candidatus Bathyarchaeota archaeon]
MFSYASKRITRGRGLSLALFLSVVLAATLFSGILQGADAVGGSALDNMLTNTKFDIITTNIYEKNTTAVNIYNIDGYFKTLKGVDGVDHFIRQSIELNSTKINGTVSVTIIALPASGEIAKGISAADGLEDGKLYIDVGSMNATLFTAGEIVDLGLLTYTPRSGIANFKRIYIPIEVGSPITMDDQTWSMFVSNEDGVSYYNKWVSIALGGYDSFGGRPQYNVVVVTENTYRQILDGLYSVGRSPTIIHSVAAVRFDRTSLLNQWDISGSDMRVKNLDEQVNGMGGVYSYIPINYLDLALQGIEATAAKTKLNTIVVTIPVFFTAWYLGMTVSDVALGLRRKEIGLLLTRGMSHRQVFISLLTEACLVGVVAGVLGVVIGAVIMPFVVSRAGFDMLFRYVSPITFAATVVFSLALSTLAAYSPVRKATNMEIVEALREYREEEEGLGYWAVPTMALLLGLYKLAMLLLNVDIEAFSPASGDFISFLLYSVWYGMDSILGYIWTILLFWGFTKLFLMYAPQFQSVLGNIAAKLTGDAARFTSLSSRRSLKRAGAYTFMAALVISYSFVVLGNVAMTNDYTQRYLQAQQGADAVVLAYSANDISKLADQVRAIDGVKSAAVEITFTAETSAGSIQVRAIDAARWNTTAYTDELFLDRSAYAKLASKDSVFRSSIGVLTGANALLDKGGANFFGISTDGTGYLNLAVQRHVYSLKIVGLFGRDLGSNWIPQAPMVYVPLNFTYNWNPTWITGVRILVKLAPGADTGAIKTQIQALGLNVQRVDITSEVVQKAQASPLLGGSQQVNQLGVIFAAAVASVGMALIVYTLLRSRSTELNLMSIKGYSARQLVVSLAIENVGLATLATILGIGSGVVNLMGQMQLFNKYILTYTAWKVVFPLTSQLQLLLLYLVIVAATLAPIILVVRRITEKPSVKGEA